MSSRVRKAVIPAAGLGTRFLPATKSQPKEMLPVVDKPSIQYVVEEAVRAGLTDILIITGRGKRAIEDHFDRNFELEHYLESDGQARAAQGGAGVHRSSADIHYVRQKDPLGLGHAVCVAREHVGDEPFAVMLGDDIMVDDCRAARARCSTCTTATAASVLALHGGDAARRSPRTAASSRPTTSSDDLVQVRGDRREAEAARTRRRTSR